MATVAKDDLSAFPEISWCSCKAVSALSNERWTLLLKSAFGIPPEGLSYLAFQAVFSASVIRRWFASSFKSDKLVGTVISTVFQLFAVQYH